MHGKMLNIINHQGNSNQNHNKITPHQPEWLILARQEITSFGEDVEEGEPSYTAGAIADWYSYCGK